MILNGYEEKFNMDRRQVLVGASTVVGVAATTTRLDVALFGVTGDGSTDDAPGIQAALNYVGRHGGGAVFLPSPAVHYRISRGLKIPSHVILEGPTPVRYPFNAGNKGACALVADFLDFQQWIIEPETHVKGESVAFNGLIGGELPDGVTYNCGVRNLLLTSKGKIPFGGIRMHGCPGSIVENVSIDRVGCGLLVNYSFGGFYRVQTQALYYGVVAWDDVNASTFEVYCAQSTPWPKTVPPLYRLSFMVQLDGNFSNTLKLSSDEHAARPYGILCGSIRSTAISNTFDAVVERFPGGIFLYNAYATDFRRCYLEADAGSMACAVVASRSRFSIQGLHAYLSGTGALFDFGIEVLGKIYGSGILNPAVFGKAPFDDGTSQLIFEGIDPAMPGAPTHRGVRYVMRDLEWIPLSLRAPWRVAGDGYAAPAVRFDPWSHRIEFRGAMAGGKEGAFATLPQPCRPTHRCRYRVPGGTVEILLDGTAHVSPDQAFSNANVISLESIGFARW